MNNVDRFNNMENEYSKYRPDYSPKAVEYILNKCKISNDFAIADIGAGTGKLSLPFLKKGFRLYCVEPNTDMYNKCVENLKKYDNFRPVLCSAENISLADNSVDLIVIGQAFHWFDLDLFKTECKRILKNDGYVAILYNNGDYTKKVINEIHELSKKYCPDYKGASGGLSNKEDVFKNFYSAYERVVFNNDYVLDLDQFIGLNFSASYAPKSNEENYEVYLNELNSIFEKNATADYLTMPNNTILRIGKI